MSIPIAVEAHDLGKRYKVYPDSWSRIVEWASRGKIRRHEEKWALQGINLSIPRGSALGVVGANGAGKSTLLKILSGTTQQTTGTWAIHGRLGSLLELGAGFHPDFNGRDNIFMNAAIMGIPKREVKERFDELAEFAELGDYLMRPVRTYSSGMTMRLAFSVAMMAHPDVLILDEVLAVGDQHFQKKCMDRMREIRQSGTTIIFVSHSIYHVRQICDRAIWIHGGRPITEGDPNNVTDEYVNYTFALSAGQAAQAAENGAGAPVSNALPHLGEIKICPKGTTEASNAFQSNQVVDIHLEYKNPTGKGTYHVGVIVNRNDDIQIFTSRSMDFGKCLDGTKSRLIMRVPLRLTSGEFYVSGYLLDESCDHIVDQRLAWCRFKITHKGMEKGVILADAEWLEPEELR